MGASPSKLHLSILVSKRGWRPLAGTDVNRPVYCPHVMQIPTKKEYTPFPPPQQPSKVDLQMESGEYFLSKEIKEAKAIAARREAQVEKVQKRKRQREAAFTPSTVCHHSTVNLIHRKSEPLPIPGNGFFC
jgi:hypothetical protein